MKKMSIKVKITLWLTVLVAVLTVVLVSMALFVSSYVATDETMKLVETTIRQNIERITVTDSVPVIDESFMYYHNGVSTLVYSKNGSLIAGQIPVNFKATAEFQKGTIRTVESGENKFLVMDMWLPYDWDTGVWIRGLADAPDIDYLYRYLLTVSAITLPLFTLLAAMGSWFIIKKSFRPLDKINRAAETINEARDLKGRINLPKGNDEFSRLAENFDDMFSRLENSFEAEKQFTADASHELRTPIAIIKSACEYSEKYDDTAEEYKETISMVRRQADKMSVLVNQLLSMTRMEQGTERFSLEKLNLAGAVKELYTENSWQNSNVSFDAAGEVYVNADKELINRLVQNLVENALKYGKKGGKVAVTLVQQNGEAVLAVKDEGDGIPQEHIDKIWNRFYQVDSSRNNEKEGAGLGLAIVQQIARIHGGYMTLESEAGMGSIFTLHLPAAEQ